MKKFATALAVVVTLYLTCHASAQQAKVKNFDRWEKDMVKFEEADAKNPPPRNHVLFIGSSSIRMWKLDQSFPGKKYINRGFGGSEIVDSTHFADRIIFPYKPRLILLYAGDNDVNKGRTAEGVFEDLVAFIDQIQTKLPETRIVYLPIKPSIKRWALWPEMNKANERIKKYAESHKTLLYADTVTPMLGEEGKPRGEYFVKDGLHMNDAGYAAWTQVVEPFLSE